VFLPIFVGLALNESACLSITEFFVRHMPTFFETFPVVLVDEEIDVPVRGAE
jgi:hypothetical protein